MKREDGADLSTRAKEPVLASRGAMCSGGAYMVPSLILFIRYYVATVKIRKSLTPLSHGGRMPVQAAQWTEFLSCPICYNEFDSSGHQPISLGCSHTVCKTCLHKLHRKACPFDQTPISTDIDLLPVNCALLQLVGAQVPDVPPVSLSNAVDVEHYEVCRLSVEELALYLKPISGAKGVVNPSPSVLSRPMQRKLVTLVNCQLLEEEGRLRAVRAARSLGERTVTELILQHQNPQQLSANLWAAVRARGCQFLGPGLLKGLPGPRTAQSFRSISFPHSHPRMAWHNVVGPPATRPTFGTSTDICSEHFLPSLSHNLSLSFLSETGSPTPASHSSASSPLNTAGGADVSAPLPRHGQFILSTPHPSQASELFYEEPRPSYNKGHFQPNWFPPRDQMGAPAFHPHPGQGQYGHLAPAHSVYAPLYDSRRVWRPQEQDCIEGGQGVVSTGKRWLHSLEHYRRLKDEDPIIPFSEAPIISKWGAISRASRTGYHTTDPVQATACQGRASTTAINFKARTKTEQKVNLIRIETLSLICEHWTWRIQSTTRSSLRKILSPIGLGSGGLGIRKFVLRTGPPHLGNASTGAHPETSGTEMLLN
ncbi:hypothetical protein GOODEAATRI_000417 [Goodea atripinnis]|uniref:RING-type domain-containing protein n=1 Tax=Goodea atripinnis TaxID=208336 RepID=A0ABV0N9Y0_9TELE